MLLRRLIVLLAVTVAPAQAQTSIADARTALAAGQFWQATRILAPRVAADAGRTPEVTMMAAQAAAGWEGWSAVRSLLERESWLDSSFDRTGRRLLAEAALASNRNADALAAARLAIVGGDHRDPVEQGLRLVLLARALDRLDQRDSAAAAYLGARALLPAVGEWLALRAAGVTSDPRARSALYGVVTSPAAAPRVPWTEAQALERMGDRAAAATAYERLSATAISLRLRYEAATTDAQRDAVRDLLVAQLSPGVANALARDALILIERIPVQLSASQRLVVARRAAQLGRSLQAVDAFAAAARVAALGDRDRFTYGNALSDLNRWPEASVQFRGVRDPVLTGHAAYFHARALLRAGKGADAVNALERVVIDHPRDTVAAGTALFLLGDLAIDGGDAATARRWFSQLSASYPTSAFASRGALLAGLIDLARGNPTAAQSQLSRSLVTYPRGGESDALRYWLARAMLVNGDRSTADSLFRSLLARGPESYYATRSAMRLDTVAWNTSALPAASSARHDVVFVRAALLERVGLDVESRMELDALAGGVTTSDSLLALAEEFLARGYVTRASQLGNRALSAGAARDARTLRLIYPMPWGDALRAAGSREQVDPFLAAAVIRQESAFNPRATSRTDARGLLQVMPAVGKELGRAFGIADLDPALLWQPEVNIPLGTRHLGNALRRYPEPQRALAAYNAGQSRVNRWSDTPLSGRRTSPSTAPVDDIELFVERIPFNETRDYVRVVMRNMAMYRMLYGD